MLRPGTEPPFKFKNPSSELESMKERIEEESEQKAEILKQLSRPRPRFSCGGLGMRPSVWAGLTSPRATRPSWA